MGASFTKAKRRLCIEMSTDRYKPTQFTVKAKAINKQILTILQKLSGKSMQFGWTVPDPSNSRKKNWGDGLCRIWDGHGYSVGIDLHSSCSCLVCVTSGGMFGVETFGPSVEEFQKRFDPETTDGEGPIRLKNLYFTYLVVLRALAKAAPLLGQESFYTGLVHFLSLSLSHSLSVWRPLF